MEGGEIINNRILNPHFGMGLVGHLFWAACTLMASDFALEGPSVVRTASIITDHPQEMAKALMTQLHRGVSSWEITGGYTGKKRAMIFCTLNRAQIFELKQVVSEINPDAFVVIGVAQQAMGIGFRRFKRRNKN